MTRNRVLWLAAMAGLLLVSTGVILAQKSDHVVVRARRAGDDGGRAWIGVRLGDVTAEKAQELKLPGEYGAVVTKVEPDSPAAKAGLENNDVILEFAGERVWSVAELRRIVRETPPGRTVSLRVSRAGQVRTVSLKLESHGSDFFSQIPAPPMVRMPEVRVQPFDFHFGLMGGPRLGIDGDELTSQLANYFGVKQGKGVLVREVKSDSAAEKAGLKAGDCIVAIDGKEVGSVDELRDALRNESGEKRAYTLSILRDRHEQTVKVEIEPPSRLLRPETADDEFEGLDDEIAELRDYAPDSRLQAEDLRRLLEAQSHVAAEMQNRKGELEKLQKELTLESQDRLRDEAAELRRQAQDLQKQSQQWKKQTRDQQLQVLKELRELLDQARQAAEPVI